MHTYLEVSIPVGCNAFEDFVSVFSQESFHLTKRPVSLGKSFWYIHMIIIANVYSFIVFV